MQVGVFGVEPNRKLQIAGVALAPSSNLVQVVRFNGRCYLKNGFHRCSTLMWAGATHAPCLFLEGDDYGQVGAPGLPATFSREMLESANPPTLGHFTEARAQPVSLRSGTRVISVSWSEWFVPDEEP